VLAIGAFFFFFRAIPTSAERMESLAITCCVNPRSERLGCLAALRASNAALVEKLSAGCDSGSRRLSSNQLHREAVTLLRSVPIRGGENDGPVFSPSLLPR